MADSDPWERLNAEIVACTACPRLVQWRQEVAQEKRRAFRDWDYWGRPVPGFGDRQARLVVMGLAPGAHGANDSGITHPVAPVPASESRPPVQPL